MESEYIADLKSAGESHAGSSPAIPTIFEIEIEEARDEPVWGTTAEDKDWCKECGYPSDIIFQGYGYCMYHWEHRDNHKWCDHEVEQDGIEYEEFELND